MELVITDMIEQLYPGHQGDDHERALERAIDGRHAEVLAERRRSVDASPLACWIDGRGPRKRSASHSCNIAGKKGTTS